MPLPPLEAVGKVRPLELTRPGRLAQALAPYVAVEAPGHGPVELALVSGTTRLAASYDDGCSLQVTTGGRTTHHRSRRSGRPTDPVDSVALALTGTHLSVACREAGRWVVRGRFDLRERGIDPRDEEWLAGLVAEGGELRGFGQLGLRDLRLVTHADGSPYREGDRVLLTATSAGPGFFDTAHTSVWSLDPAALTVEHRSDVFFRRPDRPGAYGDHASHLVRDGDRWLFATSTWGDFDQAPGASVAATLAETDADLLRGRHVLDTRALPLPTTGFTSVGVWDPHLVHTGEEWLVGYVSARRFFRFHPVLAAGPSLDDLTLRAAATAGHRETEGSTLHRVDGAWRLLASDGHRRRYPVLDLDLREVGELVAPYPSNIPWPTLLEHEGGLLLIGFDGEPSGGRLVGYGSHGAVRFARARGAATRR